MRDVGIDFIKFEKLVPVIVQDCETGEVLMLAYANLEAVELTIKTGIAHFWSRSRGKIWKKGETSGNIQEVREIRVDCDGDTLLYLVKAHGPSCHTGKNTCFHNRLTRDKK